MILQNLWFHHQLCQLNKPPLQDFFVSEVIMTFGMCSMVVIDDGSIFKNAFIEMCKKVKLNYWCVLRENHIGNSLEPYQRFLNKTQKLMGMTEALMNVTLKMIRHLNMHGMEHPLITPTYPVV